MKNIIALFGLFLGGLLGAKLGHCEPLKERTLIKNGVNAAGYAEFFMVNQSIRSEDKGPLPFIKVGWQLAAWGPLRLGAGYGSVGVGEKTGSYHGAIPEVSFRIADDFIVSAASMISGHGYFQRVNYSDVGSNQNDLDQDGQRQALPLDVEENFFFTGYRVSAGLYVLAGVSKRTYGFNDVDKKNLHNDSINKDSLNILFGIGSSQF